MRLPLHPNSGEMKRSEEYLPYQVTGNFLFFFTCLSIKTETS